MDYFKAFAAECDSSYSRPEEAGVFCSLSSLSWYVCLLSAALTPEAVATPESGTCPGEHEYFMHPIEVLGASLDLYSDLIGFLYDQRQGCWGTLAH